MGDDSAMGMFHLLLVIAVSMTQEREGTNEGIYCW